LVTSQEDISKIFILLVSFRKLDYTTSACWPWKTRGKQGCSRAWTEVDGVHKLLCMKRSILYVLCTFLTLQTSGVHPLLFRTTPLEESHINEGYEDSFIHNTYLYSTPKN